MREITQPIASVQFVGSEAPTASPAAPGKLPERPAALSGTTYKLKSALAEAALYVTINDLDGRPFEIFINSKAMEHFQWVVALTRIISGVFRVGGDVSFIVEELEAVFDPRGGYFKPGQGHVPSLVAEIGAIISAHIGRSTPEAAQHARCPRCGGRVVVSEGCAKCLDCGDSKCG